MDLLTRAKGDVTPLARANAPDVHEALTMQTAEAHANGVFGAPTFVWNNEIFFGADRLEVLAWKVARSDS